MTNCKNCDKELKHVLGRREKKYCDAKCKQKYFSEIKKGSEKKKIISLEEYNELMELKKIKQENEANITAAVNTPIEKINEPIQIDNIDRKRELVKEIFSAKARYKEKTTKQGRQVVLNEIKKLEEEFNSLS